MIHVQDSRASDPQKPYGDVTYADPGYQADKKKRYPLDSEEHCKAAWSYINMSKNASAYTPEQLAEIKGRIKTALKKYGVDINEKTADSYASEWRELALEWRYNDYHAPAGSSTGGQFSSGGNNKGPATKKTGTGGKAYRPPAKPTGKTPAKTAAPSRPGVKPLGPGDSMTFANGRGPGYGMKNGDPRVHKLQDDLVRLGFAKKGDKNYGDGKYGPKTSAAVKAAQKALGLKPDGVATPALIAKLAALKQRPHRSIDMLDMCVRSFDFEYEARSDGRTMEGYAATFNTPTRIAAVGGDFDETILPGAFKRSLAKRMPVLQFDHGKDPRIGTVPIGQIDALDEDSKGLHVRARLYDHPDIERVRQAIAGGSITGMSFRFGVPKGGDTWVPVDMRDKGAERELREIRDADVHELGPVVFPAYDTTSVSVRSILAGLDATEIREMVRLLSSMLDSAVDLDDYAGRSDTRSVDGGNPDAGAGIGNASPAPRDEFSDRIDELRQRYTAVKARAFHNTPQ